MVLNIIKDNIAKILLSIINGDFTKDDVINSIAYRTPKPYRGHETISSYGLIINLDQKGNLFTQKLQTVNVSEIREKFMDYEVVQNVTKELIDYPNSSRAISVLDFDFNPLVMNKLILSSILNNGERYGSSTKLCDENVILEYSSPNIAKPFHVGHLRSTIIGNFIGNLYRNFGANVVRINYLGDWGKQYGLLLVGYEKYGNPEELQNNPIKHLFDVYVAINKDANKDPTIHDNARNMFRLLENSDPKLLQQWEQFKDFSIREYTRIYSRLGISFDLYSGEKEQQSGCCTLISSLQNNNLVINDCGTNLIDLSEFSLGKALLTKKDGTSLYLTRDIAAAISRYNEYNFTKMIYVVSSPQTYHFKQLFKILEISGYPWASKCEHVSFGMIEGMSTRKGEVVLLDDILDEAKNRVMEKMQQDTKGKFKGITDPDTTADNIAIAAIIIQDLSSRKIKDYKFDWKRVTQFEGKTGSYLQFTYARLCSLERINNIPINISFIDEGNNDFIDTSNLLEPEIQNLIFTLSKYSVILEKCLQDFEPVTLVNYVFDLTAIISSCLTKFWIKDQPADIARSRALLYNCSKVVLGNALRLLGITPVEQM